MRIGKSARLRHGAGLDGQSGKRRQTHHRYVRLALGDDFDVNGSRSFSLNAPSESRIRGSHLRKESSQAAAQVRLGGGAARASARVAATLATKAAQEP